MLEGPFQGSSLLYLPISIIEFFQGNFPHQKIFAETTSKLFSQHYFSAKTEFKEEFFNKFFLQNF